MKTNRKPVSNNPAETMDGRSIRISETDWTLMKTDADAWTDGNVSMLLRLGWRAYREQRIAAGTTFAAAHARKS